VATNLFPLGDPPGFPLCPKCIYFRNGSATQCIACAAGAVTAIGATSCEVCSQTLAWGSSCSNWLCKQPDRNIGRIHAIAVHDGDLRAKILRLKYDGAKAWAVIFGRLLYGWVEANSTIFDEFLVVANPTFAPPGSGKVQHTELVVDAAETEDVYGLFDWDVSTPRILEKTAATPPSAAAGFWGKREAAIALPSVLNITAPAAIAGREILIYDDVCTTGLQVDAVAGFLLESGAASVQAVVLARAPWKS
jgi:predicted amidophosphoribosyltransferase